MLNTIDGETIAPLELNWLIQIKEGADPLFLRVYMAFLTGAYPFWHLRDRIQCPGALVFQILPSKSDFFIYLNIHPEMSAITCNENALLYWREAKRGVGKKGTWKERDRENRKRLYALQLKQPRSRITVVLHVGQRAFSSQMKTNHLSEECKQDSWSDTLDTA